MTSCPDCGTQLAERLLVCPGCQRLVHAERLKALAADAERATAQSDPMGALRAWRDAQPLLPRGSKQAQAIAAKIDDLVRQVEAGGGDATAAPASQVAPLPGEPSRAGSRGGVLAAVAAVVLFAVTKGKFLLLGLTKWSTLGSMLLSFGVYWAAFGWWFAGGLVLSIYVHEMGHVVALHRLGLPASAPMFIPGVGAFVRGRSYPPTPREDARVGLAGPRWGLGAALVALGLFLATGWGGFAAIARTGAWINVFNLAPVFGLDGAHAWRALGRLQRWVIVAALGLAFVLLQDGLFLLVALAALMSAFGRPAAERDQDTRAFVEFLVLIAALSALVALPVPGA